VKIAVLTAAAGQQWEAALLAALDAGDAPVVVVRRCVDVVELLAVAATGQGQVALVGAEVRHFDAEAVDRLLAADVVPVGVVPRGDGGAQERLRACGVEFVVPADADPNVIASVTVSALSGQPRRRPHERMYADPLISMSIPRVAGAAQTEPSVPARTVGSPGLTRRGHVVAVWGPTGAPGRTTVATGLADEIARLGSTALLVDADVYGGTVAAALGLLDESPGLAAACRLAGTKRIDAAGLAGLCWQVRPTFRVLTGIPLAHRWPEVRASAIAHVLSAARSLAAFTVVDCGFGLEADEELSHDSAAPRRNGATLAVLDAADRVIAVGSGDPIGIQRLVRGLGDLRDCGVAAPVAVVVNKVRRGVVGADPAEELGVALTRFAGCTPSALLPYDLDALDVAIAAGRLLAEVRPASPLRRALVALAADVSGIEAPTARHRRRS
jgi:MinD-like ATPase involved in chromosome partitioning or flagellar assembly